MFTLQMLPKLTEPTSADNVQVASDRDPHLIILQEQRKQIQDHLEESLKRRNFDDAKSLQNNLDEIDREIRRYV